jgi:hypothetical protein
VISKCFLVCNCSRPFFQYWKIHDCISLVGTTRHQNLESVKTELNIIKLRTTVFVCTAEISAHIFLLNPRVLKILTELLIGCLQFARAVPTNHQVRSSFQPAELMAGYGTYSPPKIQELGICSGLVRPSE